MIIFVLQSVIFSQDEVIDEKTDLYMTMYVLAVMHIDIYYVNEQKNQTV